MNPAKSPYLVPAAILLAGLVLSVAIYAVRTGPVPERRAGGDLSLLIPVSADDHIMGSPEAAVKLVEYADIDCEYCKKYQQVMEQVMAEYGTEGSVAWVYRHFPLVTGDPNAAMHAEAAECAASLGGPDAFWRFVEALQAAAPDASQIDPSGYAGIAESLGIAPEKLAACIAGNAFEKRIGRDFDNALSIGAQGAPFTVVLARGAGPITVSGYLTYDQLKQVVDKALASVTP